MAQYASTRALRAATDLMSTYNLCSRRFAPEGLPHVHSIHRHLEEKRSELTSSGFKNRMRGITLTLAVPYMCSKLLLENHMSSELTKWVLLARGLDSCSLGAQEVKAAAAHS